ncbi:cytochrome b [Rhizobium sp. WYJ-E13]|uniref:cytochrome b n=1 Tax=Rhizobium sp. WYJ-E13 TaxID=2849093 RepID=UPI001C1EE61C|nr:cytochrome b [Rhizobium sp. WYJ-E13]QWW71444.1 cytochrome b [Rhizobium sp. WYJ-E13]
MSRARYPLAIRVLHWIMAAIVLAMIALGWVMTTAGESGPEALYPLHKSFGLLIFLLVSLRLVFRIWAGVPELPTGLGKWEVAAAKAAHIALYVLMIVVPLMGYAMSSSFTQSDGVVFFGITVPELLPKDDTQFRLFQLLHRLLAYTLLFVVALHVLAVLKHRFLDRNKENDVLSRML